MSELRKDPIIDRWVIIAAERGRRPDDFAVGESPDRSMSPASCPFCAGNEAKTPPETWAIRDPDSRPNGTGWRADCLGDMGGFSSTWNHMEDFYQQALDQAEANDAWKKAPVPGNS